MNEQQWEEIPIDEVQPGDVARCNGREFPIVVGVFEDWEMDCGNGTNYSKRWGGFDNFGITFWRKVKREPRKLVREVELGGSGTCGVVGVPIELVGVRFLMTEILDGEDGA